MDLPAQMTLHHGESCRDCIDKHIGPALEKILYSLGKDPQRCGGCGRDVEKFKFTYWFPWPDDEPEDDSNGYDPDYDHPDAWRRQSSQVGFSVFY